MVALACGIVCCAGEAGGVSVLKDDDDRAAFAQVCSSSWCSAAGAWDAVWAFASCAPRVSSCSAFPSTMGLFKRPASWSRAAHIMDDIWERGKGERGGGAGGGEWGG